MQNHYDVEDFSCRIHKPLAYIDFTRDMLLNTDELGGVYLKGNEVHALGWMLSDAGICIDELYNALYGKTAKHEPAAATIAPTIHTEHRDESNKPIQHIAHEIKYISHELSSLQSALVSASEQIESINGDITTHGLAVLVSLMADKLYELERCLSDSLESAVKEGNHGKMHCTP